MDYIPVNEPLLGGNELKYVEECIKTGWISSEGPFVNEFENKFAKYVDRKYGVAVSNGTAALDIALASLHIGPGDEVIIPTFTIISCMSQVLRSGAKPIFVDCDPVTLNVRCADVEHAISKKTKAIIIVHIYGLPVDLDPILSLARSYSIPVIEDAAEMHGQTYNGKKCGSFGLISTFSFYANKNITTGEGGMIVTDDEELREKFISYRNLCFLPKERFIHNDLGWNFRLTNIQAAIGLAQLERIDNIIERKRQIGRFYHEAFKKCEILRCPLTHTKYADNIYWVFGIRLSESSGLTSKNIMSQLYLKGIGSRPYFYPLHLQPVLKKFGFGKQNSLRNAEAAYETGFYIPCGLAITIEQQERVITALLDIVAK
jgi:perosamine synthetase